MQCSWRCAQTDRQFSHTHNQDDFDEQNDSSDNAKGRKTAQTQAGCGDLFGPHSEAADGSARQDRANAAGGDSGSS